ncbi:MAG: class I SAM-dependent methyltransferase [Candidatus Omnitrophica bacterium]|nr:class I SAM-dependent methyltransferase [Candidatus Omnitrophota bacterium]
MNPKPKSLDPRFRGGDRSAIVMIPSYARPQPEIREIFDRVSGRYDFLNSFLSFGRDKSWRKKAVLEALMGDEESILDIGTGSGAFLEEFLKRHEFERAAGADISEEMLALAKNRLGGKAEFYLISGISLGCAGSQFVTVQSGCHSGEGRNLSAKGGSAFGGKTSKQDASLRWHDTHPERLPQFDIASSAFVLRSISNLPDFFKEVFSVIKPGGKFVILELTRPKPVLMRWLYFCYLNFYLPCVGRFLSGSRNAYQFLSGSIQQFPEISEIQTMLESSGFGKVKIHSLDLGICTLFIAEKTS